MGELGGLLSGFIAAFFTFAIFSFLYKDNPVYKLAEHIFVGVAAGYGVVQAYKGTVVPNLIDYVASGEPYSWIRLGGGILGFVLLLHVWPRLSWAGRWPIALMVGATAGLRVVGAMHAEVVAQIEGLIKPLWLQGASAGGEAGRSLPVFAFRSESVSGNVLIVIGVVAVLLHFFFSARRGPGLRTVSRIGIVFLMIAFGAHFGFTVLGRITLLIGRARNLQRFGAASILAGVVVVALILCWELSGRRGKRKGSTLDT